MQRVVLSWTSALRSIPQDQACSDAPCTTGGAVVSGNMVGWLTQQKCSQAPHPDHAWTGCAPEGGAARWIIPRCWYCGSATMSAVLRMGPAGTCKGHG